MKKRIGAALMAVLLYLCGPALGDVVLTAETDAMMPDGVHCVTLPAGMVFQMPSSEEKDLKGVFLRAPDLEMLVFAYDAQGKTVEELTQNLTKAGRTAEIRELAGERFLVYRETDEADGASCVGYGYLYGKWMIETVFFYGSQVAADLSTVIMESFH